MRPNSLFYLKCNPTSFFRAWVEFLAPYHKLTARERDVAARILVQHHVLSAEIKDTEVLRDVLWSRKSRKDMMDSLKMSQAHFQMVLLKLREAKFLKDDNSIEPKFIPKLTEDPRFVLQILFDWSSPDNPIRNVQE